MQCMRISRITFPGAIFHLFQHGVGRDPIFLEDNDRHYFLYLLKDIFEKNPIFTCFAYAFMGNHLHLLIEDKEGRISKFAKILFQRYAQFLNLKYKRMGHVFASRFGGKLCLDDAYLLELSRYIHLQPIKTRIVKNLYDYPWSSLKFYLSPRKDRPNFLNCDFILKMFNKETSLAYRAYKEFIEKGIKDKKGFSYPKSSFNIIGEPQKLLKLNLDIPTWFKKCLDIFSLKDKAKIREEIKSLELKKIGSEEARKYLIEQLYKSGFEVNEIAALSGLHTTTVYRNLH